MQINSSQIHCFLALADKKNFTAAAESLYMSQPAFSRKISSFERELGVTLIDRSQKGFALTSEGERFRKLFQEQTAAINTLLNEIDSERRNQTDHIHIGILEGCDLTEFLHDLLFDFHIQYENMFITFDSGSAFHLQQEFQTGKYDALIMLRVSLDTQREMGYLQDTQVDNLFQAEKCLVYSDKNPVAAITHPTLSDFRDQALFCLADESLPNIPTLMETNQEIFDAAGFRPKTALMQNIDAISMGVLSGTGYAILDDSSKILRYKGIRTLPLGDQHEICLVTRKEKRAAELLFRDYLLSRCPTEE